MKLKTTHSPFSNRIQIEDVNTHSTDVHAAESGPELQKTSGWGDLSIMLILFIVSGNPSMSFGFSSKPFYAAVALLFFILMIWRGIKIVSTVSAGVFIFFAFIFAYQSYSFDFFPLVTILGFFVRLFIAYAAVRLVHHFGHTYVEIIYWLALLSFIFYVPQQIGNLMEFDFTAIFRSIEPLFGEPQGWCMPIFFHTFLNKPGMEYRNAGFFWEPGTFAGYLNLGLIFLSALRDQYADRSYWKRLIILTTALLTTFSTTGYVAFPLAMMLQMHIRGKTAVTKALQLVLGLYIIIIGAVFFYSFIWEQPFMKNKIYNSIFVTQYRTSSWEADRIGTIIFDLDYIRERPFSGWGLHEETRYLFHPFLQGLSLTGRGNGMSDFAAKLGLPSLLFWMYMVYKYFFIINKSNFVKTVIALTCIMIILNGEIYLMYPMFLCFFYLALNIKKQTFQPCYEY